METPISASASEQERQLFIKMALSAWNTQNDRVTKLLDTLSDEQMMGETAPQRNRGIYLLGHLITVSDGLLPLLGLGQRLYPQLEAVFLTSPDSKNNDGPSVGELRKYWTEINNLLSDHFNRMTPEMWFSKHNSVSAEDFAKEPHRNKLNIIINRANHTSYHLGQLVYLGKK
jgi:hypothetical protein